MSTLSEEAVAAVENLPRHLQDQIAATMMDMVGTAEANPRDAVRAPEDAAAIEEGLGQIRRGEVASDEEVAAAFDRFGARRSAFLRGRFGIPPTSILLANASPSLRGSAERDEAVQPILAGRGTTACAPSGGLRLDGFGIRLAMTARYSPAGSKSATLPARARVLEDI